jgi:hypothetical protein
MSNKNYSGSIELTKLNCVRMKTPKGTEGIFIPIEHNYLIQGKEKDGKIPVYMNIRIIVRPEPDQYGQDGFISQSVDSKIYKEASEEQKEVFKNLPILGNIKDFSGGGGGEASGMQSTKTFDPKDDDLPF